MTFFASWRVDAEVRDRVLERFLSTRGVPPSGVRIIGRWHRTDGSGGFMVVEAESMEPLTRFTYEWNDLLFIELLPVVSDDELTTVISKLKET